MQCLKIYLIINLFVSLLIPLFEIKAMQMPGKGASSKNQTKLGLPEKTTPEQEIAFLDQILVALQDGKNLIDTFKTKLLKLQANSFLKNIGVRETRAAAIAKAKENGIELDALEIEANSRTYVVDLIVQMKKFDEAYRAKNYDEYNKQASLLTKLIEDLKLNLRAESKNAKEHSASLSIKNLKVSPSQEKKTFAENAKNQQDPKKVRINLQNGMVEVPKPEFAPGFIGSTYVKVPAGWMVLETLEPGDEVTCIDDFDRPTVSKVSALFKKTLSSYIELSVGTLDQKKPIEKLSVAKDQRFYEQEQDAWLAAKDLKKGDVLLDSAFNEIIVLNVKEVAKKADFYTIMVDGYHNFFAGRHHVLTHNFLLAIPIAIWGGGGIEIVAASAVFISFLMKALFDEICLYFGKKVDRNINKGNATNAGDARNSGSNGSDPDDGKEKDMQKNNQWAAYNKKHVAPKNVPWKEIVSQTKSGPAKYKQKLNIESIERMAWEKGTKTTNGKPWKVMEFKEIIGAKDGIETNYVLVKNSANTIHGHPITSTEFFKLIRKAL